MSSPKHNSVEYFTEQFADLLCEVGDEGSGPASENCAAGLIAALNSWIDYHSTAKTRYEALVSEIRHLIA